ncbi:SUMF1/EgtB/PvdO family nonheme iron enzyme [Acidihalobacter prosperus]
MISIATLTQLRSIHQHLLKSLETLNDAEYRQQFHPDLSPAGWHIGHCLWVENYWLREVLMGDNRYTQDTAYYYQPQFSPKAERGAKLPPMEIQIDRVAKGLQKNILLLTDPDDAINPSHPLLRDNYLLLFLIQHHSQHIETLRMVLTERALSRHQYNYSPEHRLLSTPLSRKSVNIQAGRYPIGGTLPHAFDNELPINEYDLGSAKIALHPVSNAEYLGFIEDGGYKNSSYWDDQGWEWLKHNPVYAPNHWRQDSRGWWYGIDLHGPYDLEAKAPVHGINLHEANAFAHWAGAKLPHEFIWEIAAKHGRISLAGQVWEWCGNSFFPYDGFKPFPYYEYSTPWYDGKHYTLRGASRYTPKHTHRPSFRNFHAANKRHIFAGVRLAFE